MRLVTFNWNATNLYFISIHLSKKLEIHRLWQLRHLDIENDDNNPSPNVTLRLLRLKPLPAQNIITVQDKAAWSPCACDKAQPPAVPTVVRCL